MILCVKLSDIKQDKEKLDLDSFSNLMKEGTLKYFKESTIPEDYTPINFMTTIRSAYTNKVIVNTIERNGEKIKVPYMNLKNIDVTVHVGTDLLMYLSSVTVMNTIKYVTTKIDKVMMQSQFLPMGVFNPFPLAVDPIIYSQVILRDDTVEDFASMLRDGFELIDIKDLECKEPILQPIYSKIVEVKPKDDKQP